MKSKLILYSIVLTVVAAFYSCGQKTESSAPTNETSKAAEPVKATQPQYATDAAFQKQLGEVFNAYAALKDGFVSTDVAKVKTDAKTTRDALGRVDMKLLNGNAHNDWMTYMTAMQKSLEEIISGTEILEQRRSFSSLSNELYKSVKAFGLGGETAYYDYCPMAFNNEGAFWLSKEDKIRNPYFGDEMLTCGEVKETLQ